VGFLSFHFKQMLERLEVHLHGFCVVIIIIILDSWILNQSSTSPLLDQIHSVLRPPSPPFLSGGAGSSSSSEQDGQEWSFWSRDPIKVLIKGKRTSSADQQGAYHPPQRIWRGWANNKVRRLSQILPKLSDNLWQVIDRCKKWFKYF